MTAALRAIQDEAQSKLPGVGLHGSLCSRQHRAHRLGTGHRRFDVGWEVNIQSDARSKARETHVPE